MHEQHFTAGIARHIWETRYRYSLSGRVVEATVEDTWRRVARALASVEARDRAAWEERFHGVLEGFRFLPGGRVLAGAGTAHRVTLFNCFVMGLVEDSMDGIFDALKEGALTMQQGGGVGYDFSTLRPRGTSASATGTVASGPVSFLRIWDSMCATLLSTGARRGAMMATLRCDHPDIEEFIAAKRDRNELRHFNLSVQASDAFLEAVRRGADWPLVFPSRRLGEAGSAGGESVARAWPGEPGIADCRVVRRVRARDLWEQIMRATYEYAEPGVLFIDRINRLNNLWYREAISATNPCGEIPLPPYGACNLGSINLTQFVRRPFTAAADFDLAGIEAAAATATRMMDDTIDVSRFPLERQAEQARGTRRLGLGLTGLADALILLGLDYGGKAARESAAGAMRAVCHAAYRTSVELARERGPFPFFEREKFLAAPFVAALPDDIRDAIAAGGIRNSHLTAIAPAGTISLLANNVSSSLEPVFDFEYRRRVLELGGDYGIYPVTDYAAALWRRLNGARAPFPPAFIDARRIAPEDHLEMQAALQPYVDNAISKTINVPADFDFGRFRSLYELAYAKGLKGCTTFRPNPVTGAVLVAEADAAGEEGVQASHCCSIERESD